MAFKNREFPALNTTTDPKHYLQNGPMTQQFLKDKRLDRRMKMAKTDLQKIKILYRYIHWKKLFGHVAFTPKSFKRKFKFRRTAAEVWESGRMTGCTDYALVFATLARKYGIPTTYLATAERGCINEITSGKDLRKYSGHAFCECFADGKWVLADPTAGITEMSYDPSNIQLTGIHNVAYCKNFVAYGRSLDIKHKQTVQEFNESMRDYFLSGPIEPQITGVTLEERNLAGGAPETEVVAIPQNISQKQKEGNEIEQQNPSL